MPVLKDYCARLPGHRGKHRSPAGLTAHYKDNAARSKIRIAKRYEWLNAYKQERGCVDCGYKTDPRAIDLDHVDPASKVGSISRLIRFASWQTVLDEMDKCVLRCANCHRIKTFTPPE